MENFTRRKFLQTSAASALALSVAEQMPAQMFSDDESGARVKLTRGYLLVQGLNTYNSSMYGAIGTMSEAEQFFSSLQAAPEGKLVNGMEYTTLWYGSGDILAHQTVAKVALANKVDLWAKPVTLDKVPAFGPIPPEFQAYTMKANGQIVRAQAFDQLNPEAMDWLLPKYRSIYLEPMKGLISGFFFDEDNIAYNLPGGRPNQMYWYYGNSTYSPRVLLLWKSYCKEHNVFSDGQLVFQFPVHDLAMVPLGAGMTAYYPGWNVPTHLVPGKQFVKLPRPAGVWKHWYDFICEQFLKNWIGRLAHLGQEVNRGESIWKGVLYFGLMIWSTPYEEIQNPQFKVDPIMVWGAWGRQRGVDLEALAHHPDVDILVCETYPPVAANSPEFVREWDRIARQGRKTLGVMMDRDDNWALNMKEEVLRWDVIKKYKPTVITRFPVQRMLPGNNFYNQEVEAYIVQQLQEYRRDDGR